MSFLTISKASWDLSNLQQFYKALETKPILAQCYSFGPNGTQEIIKSLCDCHNLPPPNLLPFIYLHL